jgi:hypothetical protein
MKALAFTSAPDTNNTGLITMTPGTTAIIVTLMNIGGTGTITGIITIEIMIGIDVSRFFSWIRDFLGVIVEK